MSRSATDALIIGGGVIGLSMAYELSRRGATVRVLEQSQFGREASWAGAGILPPGNLHSANNPEGQLRGFSHQLWPEWTQRLRDETGIDTGYRNCGAIAVDSGDNENLQSEVSQLKSQGIHAVALSREELESLEPALSPAIPAGIHLKDTSQVRNPRHLKALRAACSQRGVELLSGESVLEVVAEDDRADGVRSTGGFYPADSICIACGAWSARLLEPFGITVNIVPVRGQIVLLSQESPLFRHVIESGPRYLVPRPDGRVLIGSTEEWVGFDKRNTASAVAELIEFATQLVPGLADATLERTWAGLRPGSPNGLPYLGLVGQMENLYVAAGHFRSGLQMSPGTATVMTELMLGHEPTIPLSAFSPSNHPEKAGTLT